MLLLTLGLSSVGGAGRTSTLVEVDRDVDRNVPSLASGGTGHVVVAPLRHRPWWWPRRAPVSGGSVAIVVYATPMYPPYPL